MMRWKFSFHLLCREAAIMQLRCSLLYYYLLYNCHMRYSFEHIFNRKKVKTFMRYTVYCNLYHLKNSNRKTNIGRNLKINKSNAIMHRLRKKRCKTVFNKKNLWHFIWSRRRFILFLLHSFIGEFTSFKHLWVHFSANAG